MTKVSVNSGYYFPLTPNDARWGINNTYGYLTLDATGERCAMIGQVFIAGRPGGTKTMGGGSSAIAFTTAAITFANGSSTFEISIQDVTNSRPPVPDGTRDTYITLTGGSGLTADAWNSKSFASATGTKTIAHGDRVAVVFDFTNRAGADSVTICQHGNPSPLPVLPMTLFRTGGTYSQHFYVPMVLLTFSDGTLGWLDYSAPNVGATGYIYSTAENPDEYGLQFELPWDCKIDALWAWFYGSTSVDDDAVLTLYSDPTGTPSSLASFTVDGSEATGDYQGTMYNGLLTSELTLTKDTPYVLSVRATNTGYLSQGYTAFSDEAHRVSFPNGLTMARATRNNGSGAFSIQSPALQIPRMGIRISAFEDAAGGGGARMNPGMHGGLV